MLIPSLSAFDPEGDANKLQVLDQANADMLGPDELRERRLAILDRFAPQIMPVQ